MERTELKVIRQKRGQACYDLGGLNGRYRCAHCDKLLPGVAYTEINGKRVIKGTNVFSNPAWGICVPVHSECKIAYAMKLGELMEEQEDE